MHELTIAQNIVSIIEEELKKRDQLEARVNQVFFNTGRLNAVIPESLRHNFNRIKNEKPFLREAELVIKEIPIVIRCRDCGEESTIEEPIFMCQHCNSTNIEVISGKKMYIDSLEID